MPNVPTKGWHATITHPDTSRILRASALSDPQIDPSFNSLPRIRLPVPDAPQWQALEGRPAFTVWKDGVEQPIDELVRPVDNVGEAGILLEGEGGVELLDVVTKEYDNERRWEAAEDLINNETTYTADVDTPATFTVTESVQDADSTSEFEDVTNLADTDPFVIENGDLKLAQTCFFGSTNSELGGLGTQDTDAGGDAANLDWLSLDTAGDDATYSDTNRYDIPESDVTVAIRMRGTSDDGIKVSIGPATGSQSTIYDNTGNNFGAGSNWSWFAFGADPNESNVSHIGGSYTGGNLTGGTAHQAEIETGASDTTNTLEVDCIVFLDNRFSYNFDDTIDGNSRLDGPELFPDAAETAFINIPTTFSVVGGKVTVTIDNTTGDQRLQLSNDNGQNWEPTDGTEDNTNTVDIDFNNVGVEIRSRVRLSRYTSGSTAKSPNDGDAGQVISDYELTADLEETALLIDYSEEQSLQDHLTEIVGDEFIWAYRVVDGTPTITVTQPGQREASDPPDLIAENTTITKDIRTFHEFTVRGANRGATEDFSGSTTFTNLNQSRIIPASETVYDPSTRTNYERGPDYRMDWQNGEIRITSTGDMSVGTNYRIEYNFEVRGTYTADSPPAGYRSKTVDIPNVTTTRNAEQLAWILVEVDGFKNPRWTADILIPPGVAQFDAVEALPLNEIPESVGALEVEESPQVTPQGTAFRLGTRSELEARLSELNTRVGQLARRSG